MGSRDWGDQLPDAHGRRHRSPWSEQSPWPEEWLRGDDSEPVERRRGSPPSPPNPNGGREVPPPGPGARPPTVPETGSWSSRRGRWVPHHGSGDQPDYAISPFEDTGEHLHRPPPGYGRVLDYDEWYQSGAPPPERPAPNGWDRAGTPEMAGWDDHPDWDGGPRWTEQRPPVQRAPVQRPPVPRPPDRSVIERRQPQPPERVRYEDLETTQPWRLEWSPRVREGARVVRPPDDDWDDPPAQASGGFITATLATLGWYAVPAALYALWTLLLDDKPRPNCVDATGGPCPSPRTQVLHALVSNLPRVAVAIIMGVIVALLIRWLTTGWRAVTIGFASAVVGAGTATVLFSVLATTT